jgi:hypothetical protein
MMDLTDAFFQCANEPKNEKYTEFMYLLELSTNSVQHRILNYGTEQTPVCKTQTQTHLQ